MKYLLDKEETERLVFRKIHHSDFNHWLEFFKDLASFKYWITELKTPEEECENWYKKQFDRYDAGRGGMNALIEKQSGAFIGHAGLLIQTVDDSVELEIAYSLLPGGRNKGYATEAATKCRDFAFENKYADSLISIISLTNTPSIGVALKNGMKPIKQTMYNENTVNIFRITREQWEVLKTNKP